MGYSTHIGNTYLAIGVEIIAHDEETLNKLMRIVSSIKYPLKNNVQINILARNKEKKCAGSTYFNKLFPEKKCYYDKIYSEKYKFCPGTEIIVFSRLNFGIQIDFNNPPSGGWMSHTVNDLQTFQIETTLRADYLKEFMPEIKEKDIKIFHVPSEPEYMEY